MNEDWTNFDYVEFMTSSKRLFNRRASDDSQASSSSSGLSSLLNVDAKEFYPASSSPKEIHPEINKNEDHQKAKCIKKSPRKSKSGLTHQRSCQHCYLIGLDYAQYTSHCMRHPKSKELICPILIQNM